MNFHSFFLFINVAVTSFLICTVFYFSDKNVFFSPLSIHMAFAMTYLGAKAKTAEQIENGLCFPSMKPEELHAGFKALLDAVDAGKQSCDLLVANRHFIQKNYKYCRFRFTL